MEAKHTPGPWILEAHHHPLGGKLLLNKDGYQIGTIDDEYIKNTEDYEANAKLIASAPELLAENAKLKQEKEELIKMLEKISNIFGEIRR